MNGYHIESELNDTLKSGYYESPLGYNIVIWFVDEIIKLEKKMAFCFKNTKKNIILTQEDKEYFDINNVRRFGESEILSDKVRDHCHLTGKYRGEAYNICYLFVTQKQTTFTPFIFHNFSIYDCHTFCKRVFVKK